MITIFIEAALRSLLVALAVAAIISIFRVHNVLARKAAWGLVLVAALAMPLLLPVTAQWHLVPGRINVVLPAHSLMLFEELQAHAVAQSGSESRLAALTALIPQSGSPKIDQSYRPGQAAAPPAVEKPFRSARSQHSGNSEQKTAIVPNGDSSSSAEPIGYSASPTGQTRSAAQNRHLIFTPRILVLALYCGIAALLITRLVLGLIAMIRIWKGATPVPAYRLPADAASLQVRASTKVDSPITIGSMILLPADYKSWGGEKLRIVLAHERSHVRQGDFYLQLLASLYAALVWFSPLGWWLKHELAELAEAISDYAGMQVAPSRTSYAQILLEFAAAHRRFSIGVAMARPGSLSRRIERLINDNSFRQCFAGGRRALIAVAIVPLALVASTTLVCVQAAARTQNPSPAPVAAAPRTPVSPALLAAPRLNTVLSGPAAKAVQLNEREFAQLPESSIVLAASPEPNPTVSKLTSLMVAAASPVAETGKVPVVTDGMQEAASLSFDRTLSVTGSPQLAVSTGSGNVHITRGSENQIRIHGQIRVSHEGSEEQARQIAANPPIEQNGNVIRVGKQHEEHWEGISIDYEIEAPANTLLVANSGSGNITDESVGQNAKLETGSGDIRATSLEGPFTVKTGSGNITAVQTGQGDVVAETGSGDIHLKDIHGSFHGHTGSGDIKASGTPSGSWTLQTGSGNIELWTGNAPLTLDASTGSGSVSTQHGMMVQGTFDHHHIRGDLNGGGPTVRVQTGSGDVQIH